jgi:O-antigen/teichoic acid export membrane protein
MCRCRFRAGHAEICLNNQKQPLKHQTHNIRNRTAAGATIMIASRVVTRLIDFGTLVLLARLLSPEDFGLVAIAMSVIMIVEAVAELPLGFALVALPSRSKAHFETVFTLQLIRGGALALVLIISSWPLALLYHDTRLIGLICALAFAPVSRGLISPRIIEFSINFNFWPNLIMDVVGKLCALALSVGLAWTTKSYWSLAAGTIISPLAMMIVSYCYAPHAPVLSLRKWQDFSGYVRWTTFGQTIRAFAWQMDSLMLGRFVNRAELGGFSMGANLATLPGQVLVDQMMNPLLVAFSSVREDNSRLIGAYQKSAIGVLTLGLPIMVGMSINADLIVRFAFGEKWLEAGPILGWLCWTIIPTFLVGPISALAVSLERSRVMTRLVIIELLIKLPLMLVGIIYFGITGAIAARLATAWMIAGFSVVSVRRLIGLRIRDQLSGPWRPVMSAAIMMVLVYAAKAWFVARPGFVPLGVELGVIVAIGAFVYAGSMFVLWNLAGRPDGLESHALRLVTQGAQKVFG